jgi:hypothetical protein
VIQRLGAVAISVGAGVVPGLLLAGTIGGAVGGIIGGAIGLLAERYEVRTVVAASVTAGAVTGAFIGSSIVSVICRPETCVGLEIGAAVLTGIGAFIGVGIIVALATRSFEEYQEGREP